MLHPRSPIEIYSLPGLRFKFDNLFESHMYTCIECVSSLFFPPLWSLPLTWSAYFHGRTIFISSSSNIFISALFRLSSGQSGRPYMEAEKRSTPRGVSFNVEAEAPSTEPLRYRRNCVSQPWTDMMEKERRCDAEELLRGTMEGV